MFLEGVNLWNILSSGNTAQLVSQQIQNKELKSACKIKAAGGHSLYNSSCT